MGSISRAISVEPSGPVLVQAPFELLRALALDQVELAKSAWKSGLVVGLVVQLSTKQTVDSCGFDFGPALRLEPIQVCIITIRGSS